MPLRRPLLAFALLALATLAQARGTDNKWRLEFSGNAEWAGRIVLQLVPAEGGEPVAATVEIRKGRNENGVARDVRDGLRAAVGKRFKVEVDDGEDVLVKKGRGERNFPVTIVENNVKGVRINLDPE